MSQVFYGGNEIIGSTKIYLMYGLNSTLFSGLKNYILYFLFLFLFLFAGQRRKRAKCGRAKLFSFM